ncbi:MAG TPA: hypothetical protein VHS96_05440 [Bacteroidia bacterium]|nr:hypothetical protein [Bacteroidia bacterium]
MASTLRKYWLLFALIGSFVFAACGSNGTATENLKPVLPASMFVEHLAPFCGGDLPDKFTAGYFGDSPLDTIVYFYIVCHKGDTVYSDEWDGEWLLPEGKKVSDKDAVASVHAAMHEIVEGKRAPNPDSVNAEKAGSQPVFGYVIGYKRSALLYYSQEEHRALKF